MFSYAKICHWVNTACEKLKKEFITYDNEDDHVGDEVDGRVTSAINEKQFLDRLHAHLLVLQPQLSVVRSRTREWFDIQIDGIPVNLKMTSGGTDNAFNKVSIEYTMCGTVPTKKKLTFNEWVDHLQEAFTELTNERHPHQEYHYLAFDKRSGNHRFLSMLDIRSYKSNPSNILQICWGQELERECFYNDDTSDNKISTICNILRIIQASLKQDYESKRKFMELSFEKNILL